MGVESIETVTVGYGLSLSPDTFSLSGFYHEILSLSIDCIDLYDI